VRAAFDVGELSFPQEFIDGVVSYFVAGFVYLLYRGEYAVFLGGEGGEGVPEEVVHFGFHVVIFLF